MRIVQAVLNGKDSERNRTSIMYVLCHIGLTKGCRGDISGKRRKINQRSGGYCRGVVAGTSRRIAITFDVASKFG